MKTETKKYVIMCVGRTHSGKTTFAKELIKNHPNLVGLDSDEVAVFLRETYPLIMESPYNKSRFGFKGSGLKTIVFNDIFLFCLKAGLNVILSNGNLSEEARSFVAKNARKQGYELITVYFNLPREVILERIKNTQKSDKVFIQSKSWEEVLARQDNYAEFPPFKKNTIYFEIRNTADESLVSEELSRLL